MVIHPGIPNCRLLVATLNITNRAQREKARLCFPERNTKRVNV